MTDINLSEALDQFDRTMANIQILQDLWQRYEQHLPTSMAFGLDTPETDQIRWEFNDTVDSLPAIHGEKLAAELLRLDDISQSMLEYREVLDSELDIYRATDEIRYSPKRQLDRYQYRVIKMRRILVRKRIEEAVTSVDQLLRSTIETEEGREFPSDCSGWLFLRKIMAELDRLRGEETLGGTRLSDLYRHMYFAEPCDLKDIVETDWPSVRAALVDLIFRGEPVNISSKDLGDLVSSEPKGSVTSRLPWEQLDQETFERMVFDLLRSAGSYENVEWLMKTNAPDRGRDISAVRVIVDELGGTKRSDVVIQCRRWITRSIGVPEIVVLLEQVGLWSRKFSTIIVVTAGMFTQDAVEWREKRELNGESPFIEYWPRSHLEHLLASRLALRSNYFHQ